jgi:hypothetical protein
MVIGIIALLIYLLTTIIGILMGKYLSNMVDKNDKQEVHSFIHVCLIPIINILVVIVGLFELVNGILHKIANYIEKWW